MANYIITHNIIDGEDPKDRTVLETKTYPFYFELYDDDEVLYAKGYSNDNLTEKLFDPLDDWMGDYGCTGIKLRNQKTHKMEWV